MKLISCYVEGYGAIEKKEYFFEEGITAFCQENGAGKTTLASFLKAMFYGLEKPSGKKFVDREHFYPFKGGKFGGNLTFEKEGKTYKIERFFGKKSTTEDSLKVYCNGELTEELGEDIGKAVFGVDEASFLRTLFIGAEEIEIKSTSSINAKLGNFLQGLEEDDGYEETKKRLENAMKRCKSSDNKNATGAIPQTKREIEELKKDIDNAKTIHAALQHKYARLEQLKEEIDALNAQIVTTQKENERRKAFEHYDSIAAGIAEKEKMAAEICARYPMGMPTEEETLSVNACIIKEKETQAAVESVEFSVKDSEKLARLEESFARGVPSEAEILEAEKEIDCLKALETELSIEQAKTPTAREKELLQKFLHECPNEAQIADVSQKVEAYKKAKKEYDDMPSEVVGGSAPEKKQAFKGAPLMAAFSAILCALSAIFFGSGNTSVGIVFLLVGGVLLIASVASSNKANSSQGGTVYALNPEKQRKERDVLELEYAVKACLTRYGYHSDNGVAYDFAELQKDVKEYRQYLASQQEREKLIAQKRARKEEIEGKLTAFFRSYGLSGNSYIKLLSDLRGMVSEYFSLRDRKNTQATKREALTKTLEEARLKIDAYKRKYRLTELRINEVLEDVREHHRLCVEIEKEKAQAAALKEKEGLGDKPTDEKVELSDLQAALTEKQNERSKLEREIEADETVADSVYEKDARLFELEEKLNAHTQKYKLLKAAKELLESAERKLNDKYVKPMQDEFLTYAAILEETLGERMCMKKNFEIYFERGGEERKEKHLSAGQRSICALCFRLALIKNMYKDNMPFLILDDPFVALDKEHMEKVKELLKTLSKDVQMVYFTCHESRSM